MCSLFPFLENLIFPSGLPLRALTSYLWNPSSRLLPLAARYMFWCVCVCGLLAPGLISCHLTFRSEPLPGLKAFDLSKHAKPCLRVREGMRLSRPRLCDRGQQNPYARFVLSSGRAFAWRVGSGPWPTVIAGLLRLRCERSATGLVHSANWSSTFAFRTLSAHVHVLAPESL